MHVAVVCDVGHISTHTPLAGRDDQATMQEWNKYISTHTPLAGRDNGWMAVIISCQYFYSHAPRGARPISDYVAFRVPRFLLTRPSRGATKALPDPTGPGKFLLTRPSRGATMQALGIFPALKFLLTRPSRGATLLLKL